MKILVPYSNGNRYGNKEPANKYSVKCETLARADEMAISFDYAGPATGYGIGHAVGLVPGFKLVASKPALRALANSILAAVEPAARSVTVDVAEEQGHAAARPAA